MTLNYLRLFVLIFLVSIIAEAQNSSALYQDWKISKDNQKDSNPANDYTPVLPDFSYAGYKNGEISLPSVFSQTHYNVLDYGAVANDNLSDKAAIMAAIAAAEQNPNGGIVFFPPGQFIINDADVDNLSEIIKIQIFITWKT